MGDTRAITNPDCTDGGPDWCCIDGDGTGLWCERCALWPLQLEGLVERIKAEEARGG